MTDAFLYAAARTPFGRFGGALAEVRPDDLAAAAITGVLDKAPALDPAAIGDVVWGCANQAGEDNRNVGRMAVLLAGLPVSVPAVTVNRLCGSSLDAAMQASRAIEAGDADGGAGRRGGVDDAGAVGAAQAVAGVPGRQRHRGLDDAGLAAGQRADAGGVDGLAGRGQRAAGRPVLDLAGAAGRVRRPLAQPRRGGVEGGLLRRPRGAGARVSIWRGTRASGRAPAPRSSRGSSRRSGPTARSPRERLAAQRRRLGAAAGLGGRRHRAFGAWPRWPGSPAGAPTRWRRRTSGTRRSRRPRRRWPGPGSRGPTWRRWS